MVPINTRDPRAAGRAYLALEWPLRLGHRFRPRRGCTCGQTNCGAPGAHPPVCPSPQLLEESLAGALETSPGASLITATTHFDAVFVPRSIGLHAMVLLDGQAGMPCLLYGDHEAVLLVLPATGRYCLVHDEVTVRSGDDGWVALPPSRGVRWDTPPWIESTGAPRRLTHGEDVGRVLRQCFEFADGPVEMPT